MTLTPHHPHPHTRTHFPCHSDKVATRGDSSLAQDDRLRGKLGLVDGELDEEEDPFPSRGVPHSIVVAVIGDEVLAVLHLPMLVSIPVSLVTVRVHGWSLSVCWERKD